MTATVKPASRISERTRKAVALLFLPFVLAFGYASLYAHLLLRPFIYVVIWLAWLPRGTFVLFVYPDIPRYREHVASVILPVIRDCADLLTADVARAGVEQGSVRVF